MIVKFVASILILISFLDKPAGYSTAPLQVKDTVFIFMPDTITRGSMQKLRSDTATTYVFTGIPEYGRPYPGFWLILKDRSYQTLSKKAFKRFDHRIMNIPQVADSIGKNPGFVYNHQLIGIRKVNNKYNFYPARGIDLHSTHPEED